jgi:hypothetical protein
MSGIAAVPRHAARGTQDLALLLFHESATPLAHVLPLDPAAADVDGTIIHARSVDRGARQVNGLAAQVH